MVDKLKSVVNYIFNTNRRVSREYLASGRLSNIDLDKLVLIEEMWYNMHGEMRRIISVDDSSWLTSTTRLYIIDRDNMILPISLDIIIKMLNDKLQIVKAYELTNLSNRKDIHNLIDYLYLNYMKSKSLKKGD